MAYAIVDAPGVFDSAGNGRSWVHECLADRDAAIRRARRMRQVQVIDGALEKGQIVYADAIDRVYPSVWRAGDK